MTVIFFFFLDVRQGLIGVGLINVEDRSGILTLDKGIYAFSLSIKCHQKLFVHSYYDSGFLTAKPNLQLS